MPQTFLFDHNPPPEPTPVAVELPPAKPPRKKPVLDRTKPLWQASDKAAAAFARSETEAYRERRARAEVKRQATLDRRRQAVTDDELAEVLFAAAKYIMKRHAFGWRDKQELRAEIVARSMACVRRWQPGQGKTLMEYACVKARNALRDMARRTAVRIKTQACEHEILDRIAVDIAEPDLDDEP